MLRLSALATVLATSIAASSVHAQTTGTFVASGSGCPGSAQTDTQQADESVRGPFQLGFAFPYPGGRGSTTAIDVCSNGHVYLEAGTNTATRCCNAAGALPNFLAATPSFALFGEDLQPDAAGQVLFGSDGATVATVSWIGVPEFNQRANTCQIQLWSDGHVTMCYPDVGLATHDALVGFSPGNGAADPGPVDLRGAAPVQGTAAAALYETFPAGPIDLDGISLDWHPDGLGSYRVTPNPSVSMLPTTPLAIDSASTPTIGRTAVIDIGGIPPSATAGALLLGAFAFQPAIDLSILGMDGCTLYQPADIGAVPFGTNPGGLGVTRLGLPISSDPGAAGLTFEVQAAVIAPGVNDFGLALSNLGSMTVGDRNPIRIRASGANSHHPSATNPFWTIENGSPLDIVEVTFDWAASSNAAQRTQQFDTDQTGMNDRFDGGNSTLSGCRGTYRNGSEITCGLVFAGTPAATCDPSAATGWTTTGTVGGANADVTFRFTSFGTGDRFDVDIDTDGGSGFDGGSMAGLVVTVRLANGSARTGELQRVDALNSRLDL